jgi:hypothetical protein
MEVRVSIGSVSFERFLEDHYGNMVLREHGSLGLRVLEDVIKAVRTIYQYIEPSVCDFPIIVFKTLDENVQPIHSSQPFILNDYQQLVQIVDEECIIRLTENGQLHVWKHHEVDPASLSKCAVVYHYVNRLEYFYANNVVQTVPKISTSQASMFAINTFDELLEALKHYKSDQVRYSSCPILQQIWNDDNRLFLKSIPEHYMRDSLTHFLKIRLRGSIEVRPEQIVDDSHPVDIKVTWFLTNRLALIEIKWLGTPMNSDGRKGKTYSDFRAKQGAKQLAEYLEANLQQAPTHVTRGYLVIIDCRRAGLKDTTTIIDQQNGGHFRNHEISFDPQYYKERMDFEMPIRMFAEPKCI